MDMPPRNTARNRRAAQLDAFASAPRSRAGRTSTAASGVSAAFAGNPARATSRTGRDMGRYTQGDIATPRNSRTARNEQLARMANTRRIGALASEFRQARRSAERGRGGVAYNKRTKAYEAARFH